MVEGSFHQRRQRTSIVALAAHGAPPPVHPLAKRRQALEHRLDNVAIGLEMGAARVGDVIKLLAAFGGRLVCRDAEPAR